jgi:hypothetical protein
VTTTFCNSGAVILKSGSNVSTALTDTHYTQLINQAEAAICCATRVNYIDTYATLNTDFKTILEDAASSHAALSAIGYDMKNYTRTEAQTLLDVNYTRYNDALELLKDKKVTDFVSGV